MPPLVRPLDSPVRRHILIRIPHSAFRIPHSAFRIFSATPAYAGDVRYLYDDLGRLIAVVDATAGQTAIYQYDAVGNLLGIVRQPATTVSILSFTPQSGPIGTTVTLVGTGYSTTTSQNTVRFNGTVATITTATTIQLVVTVPPGATTGPISVTTPSGSANSSTPFTVTSGGTVGAPTISSFTPTIGTSGTALTVNGTNFDPTPTNNTLQFSGNYAVVNTATTTSLTTTVPAVSPTSGRISVTTLLGTAVSNDYFFVPPSPYTATDVESTGVLTFGSSQTVSITTSGKIALRVFDGTAGQRVSVVPTGSTMAPSGCGLHVLRVFTPDGSTLGSSDFCRNSIPGPVTLPVSGTYTVLLDPSATSTGNVNIALYSFVDVTGPILPSGAAVAVSLPTPGQVARLTFSGTANQKVSLTPSGSTVGPDGCSQHALKILNPDETTLSSTGFCGTNIAGPATLPVTGTYTVLVDPYGINTGNVTVTLYNVVDVTGPITPGGAAVAVSLPTPGQVARLTFSGTANQKVSLVPSGSTVGPDGCNSHALSILKPDGTTLSSAAFCGSNIVGPATLPVTGTYTVLADPYGRNTGNVTLTLYDVIDVTGSIMPGGAAVPVSLPTPGQVARLTFSGTANQKVSLVPSGSTVGPDGCNSHTLSILKPDGTTLSSTFFCGTNIAGPATLPVTGTYTVLADPYGRNTGNVTLTLYNVVDVTGSLTIGGGAVAVSLTTPGQIANLTFAGTASQLVTVRVTGNTVSSQVVRLLRPDNTVLTSTTSSAASFNLTQQTLPTTGTYTVQVDPPGISTGNLNVSVTSP